MSDRAADRVPVFDSSHWKALAEAATETEWRAVAAFSSPAYMSRQAAADDALDAFRDYSSPDRVAVLLSEYETLIELLRETTDEFEKWGFVEMTYGPPLRARPVVGRVKRNRDFLASLSQEGAATKGRER